MEFRRSPRCVSGGFWFVEAGRQAGMREGSLCQQQGAGRPRSCHLRFLPPSPRHPVSHPRLGEDVGGVAGVVAQLAAEPLHYFADQPGFAGPLRLPDPLQQLVVGPTPARRGPRARRATRTWWASAAPDALPPPLGVRGSRWSGLPASRVRTARPDAARPAGAGPP